MAKFTPKILAFCCNYCAYAAADLAGVSRMQYPSNIRIIRVPCTGKVDITYLLRAFETGADGVYVAGCLKGGCHFVEGNLHAEVRVKFAKELLDSIGISGDRLEMFFISSAMAPKFIEVAKEMVERITKLGPALPKKVDLTERSTEKKREFLYSILRNLALKVPEKPIPVPEGLEEFGTIHWELSKCIGCKQCEEVCPEMAIEFIDEFDLPRILKTVKNIREGKITKRRLLYETLSKVAVKLPSQPIPVPEGLEEFSTMRPLIKKCVVCEKCSEKCPEEAITIVREVDLPAIIRKSNVNVPEGLI